MEKQSITAPAIRQVLKDYWQQYKNLPVASTIAFTLPAIGTVLMYFVPPLVVAKIVDMVAAKSDLTISTVGGLVAIFAGAWFVGEMLFRIGIHYLIKLETIGINRLGRNAFRQLTERDYDFYTNNFVGSLVKKTAAYSRSFDTFTETISFYIITNVFPIIFAVIILWRYSFWLPLILVASLAIVITAGIPIIRRRSKLVALRHEAGSKTAGIVSDIVTNILAVKSFAQENKEQKTYGDHVDDYTLKYKKAADYQNLVFDMVLSPMYIATNTIGLIAAIVATVFLGLQAGAMVIVFSYYSSITRIFWDINRIYRSIESSVSEAAEFTQLFLEPPTVRDAADASELKVKSADIIFENVSFKYGKNDGSDLFLNSFNLKIKNNQRVGLVGPSGGGKTTITKLLLRFIDLQSGKIEIDGQDISRVTQESLRKAIAYVPQEPLLFHRTLFENIAYGNAKATEAEVISAAKLARADEFIDHLPHGYQTLVGERGIKLSGGQRQRVAIARALLKKSPILVLDEATSSLDSESEKYIQEGLWELMKNKTALVIAHRLSTIKHLDRIIVLEDGKIVQDGAHDELIHQKGLYAKLWSHQSGEFLGN